MKNKATEKLLKKLVSLHPKHVNILQHFIDDGRATSESDVVRQALMFYHDKTYPNYIFQLSPAAKRKKKELEQEESFEAVTDGEFATKTLKGVVVADQNGKDFVLIHQIANMVLPVPVDSVKDWFQGHKQDVEFHFNKLKDRSVEEAMENNAVKYALKTSYGIVI